MTIVALVDCEGTGLSATDEPIAIGIILGEVGDAGQWAELDCWSGYQEPSVPINPMAQRVHGLKLQDLKGKRFDLEKLGVMLTKADVLIAHNANFDARMLARVIPVVTKKGWRCSYRQWPWPKMERKRLDDVCSHFGIERPEQHDALADARALLDALNRRTGKTERSMTYMQRLLRKTPYVPNTSPPRARSNASAGEALTMRDWGYVFGSLSFGTQAKMILVLAFVIFAFSQCT